MTIAASEVGSGVYNRLVLLLFLVLTALTPVPVWADDGPAHALAMHGAPKYSSDFSHFEYVNPAAPKGGTVRMGVVGGFDSLNPFIVRGRAAMGLFGMFESLMARSWDEPFSLYGLIAETIETPPDRSWVRFTLRPQARWHDGNPITVADVLWSWATLRDQGRPNHRTYYSKVTRAVAEGERSVRFEFARGPDGGPDGGIDRELPLILGLMPILSQAWWSAHGFDQTTLTAPLGSGPYRVEAVEPGRSISYRRVADYWGRDLAARRGQHNFDLLRYDYYRDDGIALEAFKAGAYDFRQEFDPTKWAIGYDFPAVRDGRVRLEQLPHQRPEPIRGLIYNTRRPPFDDRRVREALGYALDFEWMNRSLFRSVYQRSASYYPNSELAATGLPTPEEQALLEPFRASLPPELFTKPFTPPKTSGDGPAGLRANLRAADRLLRSAGWSVVNGHRVDGAGRELTFEILLANPAEEKIALEFTRILSRLGVSARVRTVDSAQYQGRLDSFDFDLTLHRWSSTLSPGNEQAFYYSTAAADQPGSRNYPGIRSAAVDRLTAALAQSPDRATLLTHVHALDRVLLWGHYIIPLFHTGDDRVASWSHLAHPAVVPLYGLIPETWWVKDESYQ
ncbi:putative binding protein BRA0576/BS1330_II0571 [uncultured Gammaproteobacteria bacterium]